MRRAAWVLLCLVLMPSTRAEARGGKLVQDAMGNLAHESPERRARAARKLAKNYPLGARGVPLLEACLLVDESADVRAAAAKAIEALAAQGAVTIAEFLADTKYEQNVAFFKSIRLMRERGAMVGPGDLDQIEGRAARAVRLCLFPMDDVPRATRHLIGELLASDAGVFEMKYLAADRATELACAALALFALDSLPERASLPAPPGLAALLAHKNLDIAWGGVQLVRVLGVDSPVVRETFKRRGFRMPGAAARAERAKTLIEALPESSESDFNIFSLPRRLSELGSLGSAAASAIPRLQRLYKDFSVNKPGLKKFGRETGLDIEFAGAICRIDKPSEPYLGALIGALSGEHQRAAASALAECAWEGVEPTKRVAVAKAAGAALEKAELSEQGTLLALLSALGSEAEPAFGAVAAALDASIVPWAEMLQSVPKAAPYRTRLGGANTLFLASPSKFISIIAVRRGAMRILSQSSDPKFISKMGRAAEWRDPIAAWNVATAKRR